MNTSVDILWNPKTWLKILKHLTSRTLDSFKTRTTNSKIRCCPIPLCFPILLKCQGASFSAGSGTYLWFAKKKSRYITYMTWSTKMAQRTLSVTPFVPCECTVKKIHKQEDILVSYMAFSSHPSHSLRAGTRLTIRLETESLMEETRCGMQGLSPPLWEERSSCRFYRLFC